MKLFKILDIVNQIEKSSFLKILDNISNDLRGKNKEIDEILSDSEGQIKNIDDANIVKLVQHTKAEFTNDLNEKLQLCDFQLGLVIDILIRDGNSIMTRDWFSKLYRDEFHQLDAHTKSFNIQLDENKTGIDYNRKRDYIIFRNCVKTGYENDEFKNREKVITRDEKSILNTLAQSLDLSIEEIRMIYYSIVPLKKMDLDLIISRLKEMGIIFYNRKSNTIYTPDEIIWILRELVGIELSNKFFRRVLRQLRDSEINRIVRKHSIDFRLNREEKIKRILKQGISVKNILLFDVHKDDISKSEKKQYLQDLIQKKLDIVITRIGITAEERVEKLVDYFKKMEQDENIGMSIDGYEKLLNDLKKSFPGINKRVKTEFELQQEDVLTVDILTDYNIKPRAILDLLSKPEIIKFGASQNIKKRGNLRSNIIESYKDIENLYLENYWLIGKRDVLALKEKGIQIRESELGIKYEELAKKIFSELGYNVDEKLRKKINIKKAQMDILLNLGKNEVIIVECKTTKDRFYNKYSSVSRQLKSYETLCENNGYRVLQIILVSNDFSEDFIGECEYDYSLSLSLITSTGLLKILNGYKKSSLSIFPTKLFLKGGKLNEDRIVKAMNQR